MTRKELDTLWFQAMRQSIEDGENSIRYHFAALVAAAEREACARICEDAAQRWRDAGWDDYSMLLKDAAHQLRLRNPP